MKRLFFALCLCCSLSLMAEQRVITVTGTAETRLNPDVTRLAVDVRSVHPTYEEAYKVADANLQELAAILKAQSLDPALAKTSSFNIVQKTRAKYDEHRNYIGEERIGYELQQTMHMDLGMDKRQLAALVHAIGVQMTDTEINIMFMCSSTRDAQLDLMEKASRDAREKATRMAAGADCKLGKVLSISGSSQPVVLYSKARRMNSMADAMFCTEESLDITPEELRLSEQVTITYLLK